MKKVLLHIATPFAGIVTYMIVHIIAKLFFKLQEFLSHGVPIDYRTDSDSWICSLAAPAISIVAASLCTKYIAPSEKKWHYAGIVLFCIFCAIMYCNLYEAAGVVLGSIGGFFIVNDNRC